MQPIMLKSAVFTVTLALFLGMWWLLIPNRSGPNYVLETPVETRHDRPVFESTWVSNQETRETHSANMILLDDTPISVWYGGTEEGHKDVAIFMSVFENNTWSAPQRVVDRAISEAGLGRYIRKVGNPTLHVWPDGRLALYYVTVSIGGWAASAINVIESTDRGASWSQPKRLVTSPFLNISTLVRTLGQTMTDGTLSLPVYHEFMGKFSETLRLAPDHSVLDKIRMSRGKHSLQPAVLPRTDFDADAYLRYAGNGPPRLLKVETHDGGRHWTHPQVTDLKNPNAAVAVLRLNDTTELMALNDTEDGRHRLSLALRRGHGEAWKIIKVLEHERPDEPGSDDFEFSYPSLVMSSEGIVHLVYTWNQKRIRHLQFNQAWLESGETEVAGMELPGTS